MAEPKRYSYRTRLFLAFLRTRKFITHLTWREFLDEPFYARIRAEA